MGLFFCLMLHLVIILFHLIPSSSVVEFQCFSISFFLSPFVPHSILLSLSHSLFLIMAIFALLLGLIHPELCVSPAKKLMHIISDPSSLFGAHSSISAPRALPSLGYAHRGGCSTDQCLPSHNAFILFNRSMFGPLKSQVFVYKQSQKTKASKESIFPSHIISILKTLQNRHTQKVDTNDTSFTRILWDQCSKTLGLRIE